MDLFQSMRQEAGLEPRKKTFTVSESQGGGL